MDIKACKPIITHTFNSFIFSCRFSLDSLSFWASSRCWESTRTASLNMTALSVLAGLPGSRIEPNSKNLQTLLESVTWHIRPKIEKQKTSWQRETSKEDERIRYACHSIDPFAFSLYMLWNQMNCWILTLGCDRNIIEKMSLMEKNKGKRKRGLTYLNIEDEYNKDYSCYLIAEKVSEIYFPYRRNYKELL